MSILSRTFATAALERALRAAAAGALAVIGTNATGLLDTNWTGVASAAGMAAVVSLLLSISAGAATGTGPAITHAETLAQTVAVTAPADVEVIVEQPGPDYDPPPMAVDQQAPAYLHDDPSVDPRERDDRGHSNVELGVLVAGVFALAVVIFWIVCMVHPR